MALVTPKLEFAPANLATVSPAWTNVTADLIEAEWWSGKGNDLDEPQPGGARFRLANPGRKYEPEYAAGPFYPNIDTDRRFRLTLTDASGAVQQGIYYVEAWDLDYIGGTAYSEVTVTCVDGFGVLVGDTAPFMDPPDATSYPDVVGFDQPSFYYRLGEPQGTKVVHHVRKVVRRYSSGGDNAVVRRVYKKRWRTVITRAEVEGVSGPAGTYKGLPLLGEPGAILGDPDTAVRFDGNDYVRIGPLDQADTIDTNRLSVEAWVKLNAAPGGGNRGVIVGGPWSGALSSSTWELAVDSSRIPSLSLYIPLFGFATAPAASALTLGTWYHLVGTWNGATGAAIIYVNAVATAGNPAMAAAVGYGDANEFLYMGGGHSSAYLDGWIDEPAIYERVLSPARIAAHYAAGSARGYAQQLTGARIAAAASSPLWSTAGVEAGAFQLQPTMLFGQGKLDLISEAAQGERPRSLFYFDASGNPIFRDFDSLESATVQTTFGDAGGETRYADVDLIYDNEIYNVITGSVDGGTAITATNAASVAARKTKARDDEVGMPLADEDDVSAVMNTILSEWASPTLRPASVTVIGGDATRARHVLRRGVGDTVRVRRRGEGGTAIDRQCVVLGYRKSWTRERVAVGTFLLSRGFNAALAGWRLGTVGFSELGTNTVLA